MEEQVILVDQDDQQIGVMEKMKAHYSGSLHRAFSVFIFNTKGELLLQQRALNKYHSPGLWTNSCCSHPRPGEKTLDAAHRRLEEEMGLNCLLTYGFHFTYQASFSNELIEHEFDHVFFGLTDLMPVPNADEVASFKYINLESLAVELQQSPTNYSAWLNICFPKMVEFKHKTYGFLDN
ncbi:isopentenyl-diphosphate Delta-isomerase [Pedobacter sp.]|uniref:isopentenyl-diphosphate Delta-isomerase n=1 Tax=Pedobacter sp. TaxID=1411316 RepID=UPI003D7FCE94